MSIYLSELTGHPRPTTTSLMDQPNRHWSLDSTAERTSCTDIWLHLQHESFAKMFDVMAKSITSVFWRRHIDRLSRRRQSQPTYPSQLFAPIVSRYEEVPSGTVRAERGFAATAPEPSRHPYSAKQAALADISNTRMD